MDAVPGPKHKARRASSFWTVDSVSVCVANSTFIVLLISMVLMFLLNQIELQPERFVLDTEAYLDQDLIQHMRVSRDV